MEDTDGGADAEVDGDLLILAGVIAGIGGVVFGVATRGVFGVAAFRASATPRPGSRWKAVASFCVRRVLKAEPMASHKDRIMAHLRSS